MHIIAHRRNTRAELEATPPHLGVEVDIRSWGEKMVIHHDAFVEGEDFEQWISAYRHGTLILNVKEEGLEQRLLSLMKARDIEDFFFLDQSFPFLIKTARAGERRCAVRVSEFESIDTALMLAGKIDWVWVDCFTRFPLDATSAHRLKNAGFKLCLVSPELQGRTSEADVLSLRRIAEGTGVAIDAVCTKRADLWAA